MKYVMIFLFLLVSIIGIAQGKINIQRITEEIKIDGLLDETIWN